MTHDEANASIATRCASCNGAIELICALGDGDGAEDKPFLCPHCQAPNVEPMDGVIVEVRRRPEGPDGGQIVI